MPVVRREREVSTAPLPGVRKTAAKTATSEGAGVAIAEAGVGSSIAGLGGTVARIGLVKFGEIQQQARDRADSVAVLEAERRISEWENKRLYDPQVGALNVRGKAAMSLPDELANEYATLTSEIEAGLGSDRQRQAFARVRQSRGMGLDLTIQRHVFGEMNRYEGEELKATVENAQSAAIANALDPKRVGEELDRAIGAIKTHAPRLGLGPEAIGKQVAAVTSSTHIGVIERLLSNENEPAAKAYFEETRGQINGEAIAKIEKAIEEGGLRGQSQEKADEIISAGGTLTEQREKVRAIENPKLRDAVQTRVEHDAAIREREERERDEATLTTAYNAVEKAGGDYFAIPSTVRASLPGPARNALRSYAEHIARGVPVKTDLPTYYDLMKTAAENPEAFIKTNLLNYRGKLDEVEFKQLAGLQLQFRNGERSAADKDLATFRTNQQIVDDTLLQYGIDPSGKEQSPDERLSIAQLRRMLDLRVEASTKPGTKPSNVDIQIALDELITAAAPASVKGTWAGLFTSAPFFDTTAPKRLIDMRPGEVPAKYIEQIKEALTAKKRTISDQTILDAYLEARARGKIKE